MHNLRNIRNYVPDLGSYFLLKNIALIYDGTHQTPDYKEQGIPFVSVKNISSIYDYNKYISNEAYNSEFLKNHPELGDVLMTRIGDIGTPAYIYKNIKMGYYVSLARLKPTKYCSGKYLYYYIQTNEFQHELWKRTIHVAFPKKINKEDLGDCKLYIPNIKKQEKIIKILDMIELRINTQKKIIEDFKCLNNVIIHRMKVEASSSQPFKLIDIANYYNGIAHENDVTKSGYILINSKFISSDGQAKKYCEIAHFPLIKNDICIVLSDLPKGKALAKCFFIDENNKYTLNQRIACIRSKNIALSKYLYYYINRNSYFLKFDDGVNQTNLSKENILEFRIKIHTNYEKYVYLLDKINNKINDEKKILSLYEKQKQYLLNNMFI